MLEKIIGLISLFLFALRFIETDITTKIGKFKFFLSNLFSFAKVSIINTSKNKIILIYYVYCIIIYYLYQKNIIYVISDGLKTFDSINMLIFYFLIFSAAFLEKNNKNNFGLFSDNIAFSFSNLLWLIYMLYKILFFLLKEIFKFSLEKIKDMSISLGFVSIFNGIISFSLGDTILSSAISSVIGTMFGAGFGICMIDEKGKKIFYLILNHLIENHYDFLFKCIIIYSINILLLAVLILINVVLKLKNNFEEFCLYDEEVNEERRKLYLKAKIEKIKKIINKK